MECSWQVSWTPTSPKRRPPNLSIYVPRRVEGLGGHASPSVARNEPPNPSKALQFRPPSSAFCTVMLHCRADPGEVGHLRLGRADVAEDGDHRSLDEHKHPHRVTAVV